MLVIISFRLLLSGSQADDYFDAVEVKPVDQLTSQQVEQSASQIVSKSNNNLSSKLVDKSASQTTDKLRKATFKLSEPVLEQLDTFHLQLQLELGKANAPYKEVVVEEAISQLLEQVIQDRDSLIARLKERQQQSRG